MALGGLAHQLREVEASLLVPTGGEQGRQRGGVPMLKSHESGLGKPAGRGFAYRTAEEGGRKHSALGEDTERDRKGDGELAPGAGGGGDWWLGSGGSGSCRRRAASKARRSAHSALRRCLRNPGPEITPVYTVVK